MTSGEVSGDSSHSVRLGEGEIALEVRGAGISHFAPDDAVINDSRLVEVSEPLNGIRFIVVMGKTPRFVRHSAAVSSEV